MVKTQPFEKINELIKNTGLSLSHLARLVGCTRQNLEQTLNGERTLTPIYAQRFSKALKECIERAKCAHKAVDKIAKPKNPQ